MPPFQKKPGVCRLCKEKIAGFDYKEPVRFQRFLSEQGKILGRRVTGNCAEHQRTVAIAIKRARELGIIVVPRESPERSQYR